MHILKLTEARKEELKEYTEEDIHYLWNTFSETELLFLANDGSSLARELQNIKGYLKSYEN